jgi:NitT/TauT family transport system substrate-binding protein
MQSAMVTAVPRSRRVMRNGLVSAAVFASATGSSQALEKMTFITTWRAQAEHGGYYQAVAKSYYNACGLDIRIRQGGPGVDGKQLLVAGAVDLLSVAFSDAAPLINIAGFPAKAVMAIFQKNPQILMAHADSGINLLADMKGKPIMIGVASRTGFWPFLRAKYGFTDAQIRSYNGQIAPFLADDKAITQALITNEPHRVEVETGKMPKTFLLADYGYEAYASTLIVPQAMIDTKPDAVQCFVNGSIRGWIDFMKDPAPAIDLIRKDNPDNPDDVVAYSIKMIKESGMLETAETAKYGLGTMSDARWQSHTRVLQDAGIVAKDFDYREAYTLQFVNKRYGM